jgi:alpha-L-rhamnosidase
MPQALCFGLLFFADAAMAQKATWIWYPGDYEVWLSNKMQNRRTERGAFLAPLWKEDSHVRGN